MFLCVVCGESVLSWLKHRIPPTLCQLALNGTVAGTSVLATTSFVGFSSSLKLVFLINFFSENDLT